MSTIMLTPRYKTSRLKEVSKTKEISSTSESHDSHVIIGYTVLLFAVVIMLGLVGPAILSYYGGMTGLGLDMNSKCAQRIHAFEQSGYYTSQEQFMTAMSYC
jgi:hypothetical protein